MNPRSPGQSTATRRGRWARLVARAVSPTAAGEAYHWTTATRQYGVNEFATRREEGTSTITEIGADGSRMDAVSSFTRDEDSQEHQFNASTGSEDEGNEDGSPGLIGSYAMVLPGTRPNADATVQADASSLATYHEQGWRHRTWDNGWSRATFVKDSTSSESFTLYQHGAYATASWSYDSYVYDQHDQSLSTLSELGREHVEVGGQSGGTVCGGRPHQRRGHLRLQLHTHHRQQRAAAAA